MVKPVPVPFQNDLEHPPSVPWYAVHTSVTTPILFICMAQSEGDCTALEDQGSNSLVFAFPVSRTVPTYNKCSVDRNCALLEE